MNFRNFIESQVDLSTSFLFDSKNLYKEMAIQSPEALKKTQNAMQFITDNQLSGVLVGGMAYSHHHIDRPNKTDVDFLTDDIDGVKQALKKNRMMHAPLAGGEMFGGITVPELDADFLDANIGNAGLNKYLINTSQVANIGGVKFKVADPSVLAIMKLATGREKDMNDAFGLFSVVDIDNLKKHVMNLEKHLPEDTDAETILSYAQAMKQAA